jgi:hypothetical protein
LAASHRNPVFAPWLDLRAYKIQDPVERLRFLRLEMQALESEGGSRKTAWHGKWAMAGVVALIAILAAVRPAHVAATNTVTSPSAPARSIPAPAIKAEAPKALNTLEAPAKVWRVDRSGMLETYSNGLRVDVTFAEPNQPRNPFPVFPLEGGATPVRYQSAPAGIVYHTTESSLADFDETQNRRLKQLGRNLLEVVHDEHAYHYVIDRFGRVFRVVEESDIANHAGHSIWADSSGVYVNLNSSFLAVAFEAQTDEPNSVTAAQVQSARMLTEMLRSKYSIAAGNCVTHAQVSVSGVNTHIGVHFDWASQFPFSEVGLPDNYARPLPSLTVFGFEYDSAFVQATGGPWKGLESAEAQVEREAAAQGMPVARYRAVLQHRYSDILGVVTAAETEEGGS